MGVTRVKYIHQAGHSSMTLMTEGDKRKIKKLSLVNPQEC